MHYSGKCILPDNHPDMYLNPDSGKPEVVKFVHVRFPEWYVVVEGRIPYRDPAGNARGIQNMETALRITFQGRVFETNNRRIIDALRQHDEYRGKRGPLWINKAIGDRALVGCVEVDKREEEFMKKQAEFEARLRAEMAAEEKRTAARQAGQPTELTSEPPSYPICPNCGQPVSGKFCSDCGTPSPGRAMPEPPAAKLCGNCGQVVPGNFCPECGTPFGASQEADEPKRTWTCKYCGEEFASGFDLGDHKKECQARIILEDQIAEATKIQAGGQKMIHGPHSTTAVGQARNPAFDGEGLL